MKAPVTYSALLHGVHNKTYATSMGEMINDEVEWVQRDRTPRREAFYSRKNADYTYGSGLGIRTYSPNLNIPKTLRHAWDLVEMDSGSKFEACFLNRYDSPRDHLGWHADDSDVIDDKRPIAVVSFLAERELWFRANPTNCVACNGSGHYDVSGSPKCEACDGSGRNRTDIEKVLLENGSILIMAPGMQDTHQHRIPKHDRDCGTRISLTFRGLIKENS